MFDGIGMETNPQLELAFQFLEYTGVNVFLTGKAGTGKTTFLQNLRIRSPKRMIVLAPTGVAAINAGGVTIHSFFQLPFGPYVQGMNPTASPGDKKSYTNKFSREKINVIRSVDLLVIDEISMVRADLLDAVDDVLRRYRDKERPFGGVQLLMIGDLHQLAPVVKEEEWGLLKEHYKSAFFFHSKALAETPYVSIELKKVYRQEDFTFLELLNRVRENKIDAQVLQTLNRRYVPGFNPKDEEGYITLTTHNYQSKQINERKLNELKTKAYRFKAEIRDNFPAYAYPTEEELLLKQGTQVMFVKNDSSPEKRYYNGKIGTITAIGTNLIAVECKEDHSLITVGREEWTNTKYTIDEETKEIIETVEGTFSQYPLKPAWAITIHKSQGLTFEKAIIDSNAAFAHGQVYVALSRCKTFEGMVLISPVTARALVKDATIDRFTADVSEKEPSQEVLTLAQKSYYKELLLEQFDYTSLQRRLNYLYRLMGEHLYRLYRDLVRRYREANDTFVELVAVSERFKVQLERMVEESNDPGHDPLIAERLTKGRGYFEENTRKIAVELVGEGIPGIDNKEVRKTIERAYDNLQEELEVKMATLKAMEAGFSIKEYLAAKAKAKIEIPKQKTKAKKTPMEKLEVSSDILHPRLYETLRQWRKKEAETNNQPAYTIFNQKALLGIANTLPTSAKELLSIPGIGKKIMDRYGVEILKMVDKYRFDTNLHE